MQNVATTKALFERFGAQDIDGILELLNDDAIIDFYGPDTIPYAGHYEGKAECRRFFETVLSSVNIHIFEAEDFIAEGEKVVVVGHLFLTTKADGREIRSPFVHVIDCKNGLWQHFRDFMNTAVAVEAFK